MNQRQRGMRAKNPRQKTTSPTGIAPPKPFTQADMTVNASMAASLSKIPVLGSIPLPIAAKTVSWGRGGEKPWSLAIRILSYPIMRSLPL